MMQTVISGILVSLACSCLAQSRLFPYEMKSGTADAGLTASLNMMQGNFGAQQARNEPIVTMARNEPIVAQTRPARVEMRPSRLETRPSNRLETIQNMQKTGIDTMQAGLATFQTNNIQPLNSQGTNIYIEPAQVPDCPLEVHPDTETMFIMRGPLGDPEPRTCPPGTYFLRSVCSCVNTPLDKCNLRPSALGNGWYEENVFGLWIQRPCGPGSAYNPSTCDCSYTL